MQAARGAPVHSGRLASGQSKVGFTGTGGRVRLRLRDYTGFAGLI